MAVAMALSTIAMITLLPYANPETAMQMGQGIA